MTAWTGMTPSAFALKVEAQSQAVYVGTVTHVLTSIVEGDPLTGSPGQPVAEIDGGNLRASWGAGLGGPDSTPGFNSPQWESPTSAIIGTNCVYARQNEDGIARPSGGTYRLLAPIGGRWSVRQTVNAFPRIVEAEAKRLNEGGA